MLKINRGTPPTREEVLEFIRSLPADMVCTHRGIEFEPAWVSASSIDDPIHRSSSKIYRVTLTFERDLTHNAK